MVRKPQQKQRVRILIINKIEEKKFCPQCRKEFWGLKKARFCQRACRDADYYQRKGTEIKERQREGYQRRKETKLPAL